MTQVWIYSMKVSSDPDHVQCVVPWQVDEDLIFFGPCKKRIRENLRERFLGPNVSYATVTGDLFIVGVNGSNAARSRKIVWAGKLSEVMTFAESDRRFKGERYRKLRENPSSPLHVRPIIKSGELVAYEHISDEHIKGREWVSDLVSNRSKPNVLVEGRKLILRRETPWQGFDRDCCMLLENRFFAQGQGIEFDEEALEILRKAQPQESGISHYAIFGLTAKGQSNGRRGTFLKISGDLGRRFVEWLEGRSRKVANHQWNEGHESTKTCCT